jgi:hypothetical protein
MSAMAMARRANRTLRMIVSMFPAALVGGGVIATRAVAQDAATMRWPLELESRGPALFNGIESDFGERPREILFYGRDTLDVVFLSPGFWANDMDKKEFPLESLPIVTESAQHVAWYVWNNFAREAGINLLRITFVRMRRAYDIFAPDKDVSAQQVVQEFTRQWLETGEGPRLMPTIVERDERWRQLESGRYCLLAPKATVFRKCVGSVPLPVFGRHP